MVEAPISVLGRTATDTATHLLEALVVSLRGQGHDARLLTPSDPLPGPGEALLVWGNPNWYRRRLAPILRRPLNERPRSLVSMHEPLPLPRHSGFPRERRHARELAKVLLRDERATDPITNLGRLIRLARAGFPDTIAVTSIGAAETLAEHGIRAQVVPIGYERELGADLGLDRDIDVLFLGALDVPRRRKAIRDLERRGLVVETAGGWGAHHVAGDDRVRLLNRARVVLNVSRFPGQFSGLRLLLGMANAALVVSEPIYRPDPFVPGVHFVAGDLTEIPALIESYLADEDARERITRAGHDFVTRELTLERSVERIVECLDA